MKWDSKRWLDSFYKLAGPFSSPHASVRATAYHNTWHFKENFLKFKICQSAVLKTALDEI